MRDEGEQAETNPAVEGRERSHQKVIKQASAGGGKGRSGCGGEPKTVCLYLVLKKSLLCMIYYLYVM